MIMKRRVLKKLAKKLLMMPRELEGNTLNEKEIKKEMAVTKKKSTIKKKIVVKMKENINVENSPRLRSYYISTLKKYRLPCINGVM